MRARQLQFQAFAWDARDTISVCSSSRSIELYWIRAGSGLIRNGVSAEELRSHHLLSLNTESSVEVLDPIRGYQLRADRDLVMTCLPEPLPPSFSQFLQHLNAPMVCLRFSQRGRSDAEWFLHRLMWEHDDSSEVAWASIRLTVAQFLLLCYREWSSAGRDNEVISTTGETVVRLLREYIDQHFNESLGLQQLSRRAGYAPSYLSSLFSKANGQGLSEYISRKRIAGAQHLLKSSDLKVVDICYRVGFKDLAHFNRTFKRFVGIPPNQYRRSCAGPNARRERSSGSTKA